MVAFYADGRMRLLAKLNVNGLTWCIAYRQGRLNDGMVFPFFFFFVNTELVLRSRFPWQAPQ